MIKHEQAYLEHTTTQYWEGSGISNSLSLITADRMSHFFPLQNIVSSTILFFFFISNEENSVCGIIVSFLIYLAVHTRVYVTIHELNMLRHCTATSVVLSINRTM